LGFGIDSTDKSGGLYHQEILGQCTTERVKLLRCEYWELVKNINPEHLVFLDAMGVLLGLTRTHVRGPHGSRTYDLKPFYRGAKVTVVGAISLTEERGLRLALV
jgi:hypothetical protein